MPASEHIEWPPPSFKVFTRSGKYIGYGFQNARDVEVYPPGGEAEALLGLVAGGAVRFSSEELAGYIRDGKIFYNDGSEAGHIADHRVVCSDGTVAGWVEGGATPEAIGGAVLLLILNRWFSPDESPNSAVF